jgi:hypothetical protein
VAGIAATGYIEKDEDGSPKATGHRGVQGFVEWLALHEPKTAAALFARVLCGDECFRDSVDVGVGWVHGPYGCPGCGWSEDSEYDLSEGKDPVDERGGAIDQYGGYHPPGSSMALAYRLARAAERKT